MNKKPPAIETVGPDLFKRMVEAGAVLGVVVAAHGDGFNVVIHIGSNKRPLATFRGNVRTFKSIQTVLSYLHESGIGRFEVDISRYVPKAR